MKNIANQYLREEEATESAVLSTYEVLLKEAGPTEVAYRSSLITRAFNKEDAKRRIARKLKEAGDSGWEIQKKVNKIN